MTAALIIELRRRSLIAHAERCELEAILQAGETDRAHDLLADALAARRRVLEIEREAA